MSVVVANGTSTCQPYQCAICQSRFTRLENLKRHSLLHSDRSGPSPYVCELCDQTFSRPDLRRRHLKRKHPGKDDDPASKNHKPEQILRSEANALHDQARNVTSQHLSDDRRYDTPEDSRPEKRYRSWDYGRSDNNHLAATRILSQQSALNELGRDVPGPSEDHQDDHISAQGVRHMSFEGPRQSVPFPRRRDSAMRLSAGPSSLESSQRFFSIDELPTTPYPSPSDRGSDCSGRQHIPDGLSSKDMPFLQDDWTPTAAQATRGYHLYFTHVSRWVPFLHRPTFDATDIPLHLGLSLMCLGYQHGEDPACGDQAGSGSILSLLCFHRARARAAAAEEEADDLPHNLSLVQSYWLLSVCAMMYLGGRESAYGPKLHSRMISLVRFGGLSRIPPIESDASEDLDSLWRVFICAESHKRTLLAVHQIDALWYFLFSIPRSLSHLEIKADLPCPEDGWIATSSSQWAHRRLLSSHSEPTLPFADAVRYFVSASPNIESLPAFDPYGAINIAQFLLSSAREVSGWSTMTGRLSLERFEPLRSSLVALEPFIRARTGSAPTTHAVTCEATWEMAMIELHMWSISHTCGIINGSVEGMLNQSTLLALSCETPFEPSTASAIQPHIDWFLNYLDAASVPCLEPPWIALYAYKVFLLAWQMTCNGAAGAMQAVGVEDGDVQGAVDWAADVFGRRRGDLMGRSVVNSLHLLQR